LTVFNIEDVRALQILRLRAEHCHRVLTEDYAEEIEIWKGSMYVIVKDRSYYSAAGSPTLEIVLD
jgi:hypothetical protein